MEPDSVEFDVVLRPGKGRCATVRSVIGQFHPSYVTKDDGGRVGSWVRGRSGGSDCGGG